MYPERKNEKKLQKSIIIKRKNEKCAGEIRRIFFDNTRQNGEICRAVSGRSYCLLSLYVLNCDLPKKKQNLCLQKNMQKMIKVKRQKTNEEEMKKQSV